MDETPAEWCARATGDYVAAMMAFQIEWQRLAMVSMSRLAAGYPTLDDGYDSALDSLEDADNERSEAVKELDRESLAAFRPAPRIKWRNGERFGIYHD
jgi:hypothetical protein